jgi:hypothetical protein
MYNRILNRPMFKRGGDVMDAKGTGITSGLDTPRQGYHRGRVVRPGGYNGDPKYMDDIEESMKILGTRTGIDIDKIRKANIVTPEQKSGAFWEGISQFGGAKTLSEAVMRGVEAQSKAIKPYEEAVAKKDLMLDELALTADLNIGMKGLDIQSQLFLQKMGDTNRVKVAEIAASSTATAQKINNVKEKYTDSEGNVDTSNPGYIREMEIINSGFNKLKEATALAKIIIQTTYPELNTEEGKAQVVSIVIGIIDQLQKELETTATGGRVGYQFGTNMQGVQPQQGLNQLTQGLNQPMQGLNQPTQVGLNVDETISTPAGTVQEDVSIREKIQPSVNMTYEEFRAKMPPEVDDDIVQLIYYNEDAFADFAQIKTQDEVYAFNNKWGVTLVLPFNTEIT